MAEEKNSTARVRRSVMDMLRIQKKMRNIIITGRELVCDLYEKIGGEVYKVELWLGFFFFFFSVYSFKSCEMG